jgi:SAM-dependent methyltransferase
MKSITKSKHRMQDIYCPLCKGNQVKIIEEISTQILTSLWLNQYGEGFRYLFGTERIDYLECIKCRLRFFYPSFTGDEHFYNVLQKSDIYYLDKKEEYDIASKYITKKDDVLEIGSGKGAFSKLINYNTYTGLEFSTNAKSIAKQEGIQIINQSIQNHSILNKGIYDVVCIFQVLEHVNCLELFDFLQSAVNCLKNNGRLIISVPSADSFSSKMPNAILNLPPHHVTHWPNKTLNTISEIFLLDILEFKHDELSFRNESEYLSAVLSRPFNFNRRLIYLKPNILFKILWQLPRLMGNKLRKFLIKVIRPKGHSVTYIYKKSID